jgi:hypothetical protein
MCEALGLIPNWKKNSAEGDNVLEGGREGGRATGTLREMSPPRTCKRQNAGNGSGLRMEKELVDIVGQTRRRGVQFLYQEIP